MTLDDLENSKTSIDSLKKTETTDVSLAAIEDAEMVANEASTKSVKVEEKASEFSQTEDSYHNLDGGSEKQTTVFSVEVDHSGTIVRGRGWLCGEGSKRSIIIIHDLGQDLSMYRYAAHALVENGFNAYAFDLRGHGRSGGRLGYIPKFETLVKDLLQVVAWVRKKEDGRLPILMGQGIGALIVSYFQSEFPKFCDATVLLSPCFKLKSPLSKSKWLMVKAMAEVTPKMRLPAAITPVFSNNAFDEHTSLIRNLTHQAYPGITANFAYELLIAMQDVESALKRFTKPTLIVLPENDTVCAYEELHLRIKDIECVEHIHMNVEGHQILTRSKDDLQEVFEHVLPWLNKLV